MLAPRNRLDATAITLMVALCACWGVNQVAIKLADAGIEPVFQAGLRSAGAAVLVWAWSRWRGIPIFTRDGTLGLGLLIAVLFAGEFVFLFWGLVFTTASRAVLFLYMSPFVVALGAHLFIPGERLKGIHVLGLACAFVGVAIAFTDSLRLPTHRELLGDGMAFIAALLWGATTVVVKASRLNRTSPHKVLLYQLGGSAVVLLALSRALGESPTIAATPVVLGALAYQIVIVAFISYLSWFWLISRYPAFRLSTFSFLAPLFGLAAGGLLLSEPITASLLAAMALVGLGIYLVNRNPAAGATAIVRPALDTSRQAEHSGT